MVLGTHAVVLGGSVAGLCAAGAIADQFDHVTVLERDELPANAEHRRGVPQSKHPHFLLNAGRQAMNALFPGFEDDLIAAGGMPLMPSVDAAYLEQKGWAARKKSSMTMIYSSRILVERVLRDRVLALDNVTIREAISVSGLEFAAPGKPEAAVTGVHFSQAKGEPEYVNADLVVDAMGRGSSVSKWMRTAGWPEVPTKTLDAKVTYTSRWYDLPDAAERPKSWWWQHIVVMPTQDESPDVPEHAFLSNFFPIEGNRVIVCMGSWGLDMPRSVGDFTSAAKKVRTPLFAEAMDASTPTSNVHLTRSTGNIWRQYDELTSPAGLVFVGDSICAFNPFYGQGMSSAAMSAEVLQETAQGASRPDSDFVRRYLAAQRKQLKVAWSLALARDQAYVCATGTEVLPEWQRKLRAKMTWPFFNAITGAAREYDYVDEHFGRVFNLDESIVQMLTNPKVLATMARYQVKALLKRATVPYGFDPMQHPPATDYSNDAEKLSA